jgi:myosin V
VASVLVDKPPADLDTVGHAQAVTFLVIHQKHKKSLEEITNDLCPVLSVQQLYRISTMYWDERYNTETVSHDVLGRMKQLMVDNNTAASHSFLLDDDSSIPFSLDDIQNLMEDKVLKLPACGCAYLYS